MKRPASHVASAAALLLVLAACTNDGATAPIRLVASAMPLANLVRVDCSASCANPGTYQRAFLSTGKAANARTGRRCSGYR